MAYMKQIRIKQALNGYIVSTAAYKEMICKDLEEVIRFVKNHFSQHDQPPKRFYGDRNPYKPLTEEDEV